MKDKIDKKAVIVRRLIVAKQLYIHALDHAQSIGAINKMIAIHNFHNALETVLRTIILEFEIRGDKQLNIDFETMLNDIDNFKKFKDDNKKLPYRQELRNLNQIRNLVQHHAHEPETNIMEEWKVFTHRFLQKALMQYFDIDYNQLSVFELVYDQLLKDILSLSIKALANKNYKISIILSKYAFLHAEYTLPDFLPKESNRLSWSVSYDDRKLLGDILDEIEKRIE